MGRPIGWQTKGKEFGFNMSKPGYVYIMTNRRYGTLYVGVTSDLTKRVYEHRTGAVPGFTKRYSLKKLVYYEAHDDIEAAIAREKVVKKWRRSWKLNRVNEMNAEWRDLFDDIVLQA